MAEKKLRRKVQLDSAQREHAQEKSELARDSPMHRKMRLGGAQLTAAVAAAVILQCLHSLQAKSLVQHRNRVNQPEEMMTCPP
jgi:hypothetical protein